MEFTVGTPLDENGKEKVVKRNGEKACEYQQWKVVRQ